MLEVIVGGRGHGKSTYATYKALYDYQIRHKAIYANFWIDIPHALPNLNNPEESIENASVIFDEAYIAANARLSMSKQNRAINYAVFQSRKADIDLYFITQLGRTIDILIRDSADKLTMCRALYRDENGVLRVKDRDTDTIEAVSVITYDQNNDRYHSAIFDPKPFFAFFDTRERIRTQPQTYTTKAERDKLIKKMIKAGKAQKEIAEELGITPSAISQRLKKLKSA